MYIYIYIYTFCDLQNFLSMSHWQSKLIGDVILNFYSLQQKLVSGILNKHQLRDLVNDLTNRRHFQEYYHWHKCDTHPFFTNYISKNFYVQRGKRLTQ